MQHSSHSAKLERIDQVVKGLTYPWGCDRAPAPGQLLQVAEGVWWLHMPLPFSLNRINLWMLEEPEGWTVIDTGIADAASKAVWEALFAGFMSGRPLRRVIVTHMHPDHVGLAGWLVERFSCDMWMSRTEFLMCRNLVADTGRPAPEVGVRFYHEAGFDPIMLDQYRARFGEFGRFIENLPPQFQRLTAGQALKINGRYWQVVVGHGHSPEHVCLYCPALNLLISGDQVLPRISSNVSLFPTEPFGDPLSEWLASCAQLRQQLPSDVLVLPAHQEPFTGLHERLMQMQHSHERSLERLYRHLRQPARAVDCFSVLFRRRIHGPHVMLATGESLAHLNCLISRRMIDREIDEFGVAWYRQRPELELSGDLEAPVGPEEH